MTLPPSAALPWADDRGALRAAGDPGVGLCTIVNIEGSFSRRLGAQLAVHADGTITGSLADGCLERQPAGELGRGRHRSGGQSLRQRLGTDGFPPAVRQRARRADRSVTRSRGLSRGGTAPGGARGGSASPPVRAAGRTAICPGAAPATV